MVGSFTQAYAEGIWLTLSSFSMLSQSVMHAAWQSLSTLVHMMGPITVGIFLGEEVSGLHQGQAPCASGYDAGVHPSAEDGEGGLGPALTGQISLHRLRPI